MRFPPIDRRALVHSVKWTPKRILMDDDEESLVLEHVRLGENITLTFHKKQIQETNIGNWRMWWDAKYSTPFGTDKNGNQRVISIGDTIEFLSGSPIYPKLTQVLNVIPQYDVDGSIHHLEIVLL